MFNLEIHPDLARKLTKKQYKQMRSNLRRAKRKIVQGMYAGYGGKGNRDNG